MYSGPASCILNMQPKTQLASAFFIADELRAEVMQRNEIANMMDVSGNTGTQHAQHNMFVHPLLNGERLSLRLVWFAGLPEEIENNYHSLYPLETTAQIMPTLTTSSTYRAINSATGAKYCVRRLHGKHAARSYRLTIRWFQ